MDGDRMRAFIVTWVQINGDHEVIVATDDLLIRQEFCRWRIVSKPTVVVASLANLFKSLGLEVEVTPVCVLNPTEPVREWAVDYDDASGNSRRITLL